MDRQFENIAVPMKYYLTAVLVSATLFALMTGLLLSDSEGFLKFLLLGMVFGGSSAAVNAFLLRYLARRLSFHRPLQWILVGILIQALAVAVAYFAPVTLLLLMPLTLGPCLLYSFAGPEGLLLVSLGTCLALYYADKADRR